MPSSQDFSSRLRDEIHRALAGRLQIHEEELQKLRESLAASISSLDALSLKPGGGSSIDTSNVEGIFEEVLADADSECARRKDEELSFLAHFSHETRQKETQEEILNLLLDAAHRYAPRLVLFVTRGNRFMSWSSRGLDSAAAAGLGTSSLSLPESPLLQDALHAEGLQTADDISGERTLLQLLPDGVEGPWHAFPLSAIGRSVAVLLAMAGDGRGCDLEPLCILMNVTGLCIENLALRILQETRAMETADSQAPVPPETDSPEQAYAVPPSVEIDETGSESACADTMEPLMVEETQVEEVQIYELSGDAAEPSVEVACAEAESMPEIELPLPEGEVELHPEIAEENEEAPEVPLESHGPETEKSLEPLLASESVAAIPLGEPARKAEEEQVEAKAAVLREVQPLSEEEKLHADAKRFARLLATEIKLYNEQRVTDGRTNRDLYLRLKRDIDRSREMYEKRVSPIVSRKIDYFHDEIVRVLADDDPASLGSDYPGPHIES